MNHMQVQAWATQEAEIAARRERTADKIAAALLMVAVMLFAAAVLAFDEPPQLADAVCVTDTDCQELCDPADELCDGGPQP